VRMDRKFSVDMNIGEEEAIDEFFKV
jgi:hypothetical protein